MKQERIKSGKEVLDEFLKGLDLEPDVDETTRKIVRNLWASGELTETRLERELQKVREELLENDKD